MRFIVTRINNTDLLKIHVSVCSSSGFVVLLILLFFVYYFSSSSSTTATNTSSFSSPSFSPTFSSCSSSSSISITTSPHDLLLLVHHSFIILCVIHLHPFVSYVMCSLFLFPQVSTLTIAPPTVHRSPPPGLKPLPTLTSPQLAL